MARRSYFLTKKDGQPGSWLSSIERYARRGTLPPSFKWDHSVAFSWGFDELERGASKCQLPRVGTPAAIPSIGDSRTTNQLADVPVQSKDPVAVETVVLADASGRAISTLSPVSSPT